MFENFKEWRDDFENKKNEGSLSDVQLEVLREIVVVARLLQLDDILYGYEKLNRDKARGVHDD